MIAEAVRTALGQDGHVTDAVTDGVTALGALSHSRFDIVLLDLGLPRKDGLTVLRQLRERGDATPVIIITARDDVRTRVAGLDSGADDYLVKPFDLDELAARMRAALRRSAGRGDPVIEHHDIRLNTVTREVHKAGDPVTLSAKEFAVLEALMKAAPAALSAEDLLARAWDENADPFTKTVQVTIGRLRRKLGHPDIIETIPTIGYRITD